MSDTNEMKHINEKKYATDKKEKHIFEKLSIRIFYVVLVCVAFLGLLIPLRPSESKIEKRTLTKFPEITVETFVNGEFFSDVSTWYADTFPFRESLLTANSKVKNLYGIKSVEMYGTAVAADEIPDADAEIAVKEEQEEQEEQKEKQKEKEDEAGPDATIHDEPEHVGTIYIADNKAFELYGFSIDGANGYIEMLNTVAKELEGTGATVYDMLVPTSIAVNLDEKMQEKIGSSSEKDSFDYIYGHLDDSIVQVPILDVLKKHNSEYLYFNTDHHWTADGAYYAYRELMKKKNVEPCKLTDYKKQEFGGFLGSLYAASNQSEALKNNPDTVVTYEPQVNDMTYIDDDGNEMAGYVISDATDYSAENKYVTFINGDQPYEKVENPNVKDDSSCVVVKESYGCALVPFLVNNYHTIHVVDYRYYKDNLISLIKDNQIQDVIYVNNAHVIIENRVDSMNQILTQ